MAKLTAKQEKFCQEIAKGKTQREAMLIAYPSRKNWTQQSIDVAASQLMNNKLVISRLQELRAATEKKVIWNRTRALKEINYVLEMHKKDIERIDEACQTEIDLLNLEIDKKVAQLAQIDESVSRGVIIRISKEIKELNEKVAKLKKQKRMNGTNTRGILEASKILNRMYGLDITKVEIKEPDSTREYAKQLSLEELRAIAYANRNTGKSTESN